MVDGRLEADHNKCRPDAGILRPGLIGTSRPAGTARTRVGCCLGDYAPAEACRQGRPGQALRRARRPPCSR